MKASKVFFTTFIIFVTILLILAILMPSLQRVKQQSRRPGGGGMMGFGGMRGDRKTISPLENASDPVSRNVFFSRPDHI